MYHLQRFISRFRLIRNLVPEPLLLRYHAFHAWFASALNGFPTEQMIVIGVTGTKGKTSTVKYIASVLQAGGIRVGYLTTAFISRDGKEEILNPYHMSMPNPYIIQKLLKDMYSEGLRVVVVETTSEGIKQNRHLGIRYDVAVFTNLTPEHLPSHGGSFEKYKGEKLKLFKVLQSWKKKSGVPYAIPATAIVNKDSEHAQDFLKASGDAQKMDFSFLVESSHQALRIDASDTVSFSVNRVHYTLSLPGSFNIYNALGGICVGELFGLSFEQIARGVSNVTLIPGRMEEITVGQGFKVFVDYAHEKISMKYAVDTARGTAGENGKVIVLLGAEGGGRDKAKRSQMGEVVGRYADFVVVSNVDPYEDDPQEILSDIKKSVVAFGKVEDETVFTIEDRREGIRKALTLARPGDCVMITGKGAEQSMIVNGKELAWDDRVVVREELTKIYSHGTM